MKLFDSHFHIIDYRFPLARNEGFLPGEFTCEDYRRWMNELDVVGGCIVSGSYHGYDQEYLLHALENLGPTFVGVTQLPYSASDEQIQLLDEAGVRGVRMNLRRGASVEPALLSRFARRLYELVGWHIEIYAEAETLEALSETLADVPALVIDHLGLARGAAPALTELVERGAWVKASGFGRLDVDPVPVIRQLLDVNPRAVIFGSDLPSTRAPRPFDPGDIQKIADSLDPEDASRVLYGNAVNLYKPSDPN